MTLDNQRGIRSRKARTRSRSRLLATGFNTVSATTTPADEATAMWTSAVSGVIMSRGCCGVDRVTNHVV